MWTVLVISTFFQVLAMFGIGQNNATALEAGKMGARLINRSNLKG